jgi:transposase
MQNSLGNRKRAYRRHDVNLKRRLASLCCEPGVSVAAIAREHDINANMLFMWRKQYVINKPTDAVTLLPVQVKAEVGQLDESQTVARFSPHTIKRDVSGPLIEIETSGVFVRLRGPVDEASLRSVLRAVRGST